MTKPAGGKIKGSTRTVRAAARKTGQSLTKTARKSGKSTSPNGTSAAPRNEFETRYVVAANADTYFAFDSSGKLPKEYYQLRKAGAAAKDKKTKNSKPDAGGGLPEYARINLAAFRKLDKATIKKYSKKFVLFHNAKWIAVFDSSRAGLDEGYKRYPKRDFLVQENEVCSQRERKQ